MPQTKATIKVDQTNVQPGDTITFTTMGRGEAVSIQVFPDSGNPDGFGPLHDDRQDVGKPFTLPTDKWEGPASIMACLEDNKGVAAQTGFRCGE